MSMNRAILIGRVGRDPEVRRSNSGDAIVNFSLATSDTWRDKASGERKERTEWHNVVCFNENIGKIIEQYVKKGSQICVEGSIHTREYTDRDGNQRKATEIVIQRFDGSMKLLGSPNSGASNRSEDDYGKTTTRESGGNFGRADTSRLSDEIDDSIPF